MTEPYRVVLADDHAAARAGTRMALEGHGFTICAEAADAQGAVEAAVRERPDVCVLDVHMPGGGVAAAGQIAAALPATAIVMLTVSADEEDLFDSIRAGAAGYLLKDTDPERLPAALEGVLAGEAAIPRRLVSRILEEFSERRRRRLSLPGRRRVELTPREWEILELLQQGLTTTQVAHRLSISQVTVRRHISEFVRKLEVPNRQAALELLEHLGPGANSRSGR
jgi:DNA-binding NarL/FixJ family response regulator